MKALLLAVPLALGLSACVGYPLDGDGGYPGDGDYGGGYPGSGYPDPGYGQGVFRCESRDNRTRECTTDGRRVRLLRQLSDAPCVQGRTWGYTGGGIWVSSGCRAEFVATGGYDPGYGGPDYGAGAHVFRCESRDNRSQHCPADTRGGVRLVRQLSDSPCIEGRSWGYDRGGVWVSHGCRAQFESGRGTGGGWGGGWGGGYGQTVRCESSDRDYRRCSVPVRTGVQLIRQLSGTRCVQGRNWGWDRSGIWVDDGCRAEFRVR